MCLNLHFIVLDISFILFYLVLFVCILYFGYFFNTMSHIFVFSSNYLIKKDITNPKDTELVP